MSDTLEEYVFLIPLRRNTLLTSGVAGQEGELHTKADWMWLYEKLDQLGEYTETNQPTKSDEQFQFILDEPNQRFAILIPQASEPRLREVLEAARTWFYQVSFPLLLPGGTVEQIL